MTNNAVLHAEPGRLQCVVLQATGRVIANFAWQHLKAATIFRDQVVRLEAEHVGRPLGQFFEQICAYASACIMSATASLEALINELFIAPGRLRGQLADFEVEFWGKPDKPKTGIERKPILEKYQLALTMLGVARLDESSSPYRSAWALVELRNALIHYKPTWDPERRRVVELGEALAGRFVLSPFVDAGANFIAQKCMSAGCAKWAVETVGSFAAEFDRRTHLDEKKMTAFKTLAN